MVFCPGGCFKNSRAFTVTEKNKMNSSEICLGKENIR